MRGLLYLECEFNTYAFHVGYSNGICSLAAQQTDSYNSAWVRIWGAKYFLFEIVLEKLILRQGSLGLFPEQLL